VAEPLPAQAAAGQEAPAGGSAWLPGSGRASRRAERLPLMIQRTSWRGVASADCSSGLQQAMGERRGAAMARI